MSSYHFVGVGGSGMSALAQVLIGRGNKVSGSDRSYDLGVNLPLFDWLSSLSSFSPFSPFSSGGIHSSGGIQLFPQDGSGVNQDLEAVVVSTAVEESIPDVARARQLNIPVRKRAEILAELLNNSYGIAVAGTSGKSTVTGMLGHVLTQAGRDPTIINGGAMKNFPRGGRPNNMRSGSSNTLVAESDESDGSIVNYCPALAIITNISKDHKDIPELKKLFQTFASQTREKIVVNGDCPNIASLTLDQDRTITFSLKGAPTGMLSAASNVSAASGDAAYQADLINLEPFGSTFKCQGQPFRLRVPGLHNIANALATIAAASYLGVPMADIAAGLADFQGISRRFDLIGEVRGIRVIDDFAHNPDKIAATLKAASLLKSRLIVLFQPHGFGPTRFFREELIDSLASGTSDQDVIFLPEIFYAGGTTTRDISSQDLAQAIQARGRDARYGENRQSLLKPLVEETRPGDTVLVMGARDDTLTSFCREVLRLLEEKLLKKVK
ncbi:MAG: Mur ligase domain-containing protein [bacterium]